MRLLLETHVLLWALSDPERLDERTRADLVDGRNTVLVSAASIWEIAIKRSLGKSSAPSDLLTTLTETGFGSLSITAEHAVVAGGSPLHHRDPFDRMLVAQARVDDLRLVTADERFRVYDIDVLDA